jgi:pseudouridine synthase
MTTLPNGMFPVGRLDKDSCGLLLLCNNGELAQQLLHPDFSHEKEYLVQVRPAPSAEQLIALAAGPHYSCKNQLIKPRACVVAPKTEDSFGITLTEGRYRQIRLMCKAVGLTVIKLQRIRLQHLELGELAENTWRLLSSEEISNLLQSIKAISAPEPSQAQTKC